MRATGAVMAPFIMLVISLWCIRVPFAYSMVGPLARGCDLVELPACLDGSPCRWPPGTTASVAGSKASMGSGRTLGRLDQCRIARPLVVRCGAFGDMVLLTALIAPL